MLPAHTSPWLLATADSLLLKASYRDGCVSTLSEHPARYAPAWRSLLVDLGESLASYPGLLGRGAREKACTSVNYPYQTKKWRLPSDFLPLSDKLGLPQECLKEEQLSASRLCPGVSMVHLTGLSAPSICDVHIRNTVWRLGIALSVIQGSS